jgi:hypothetical protein
MSLMFSFPRRHSHSLPLLGVGSNTYGSVGGGGGGYGTVGEQPVNEFASKPQTGGEGGGLCDSLRCLSSDLDSEAYGEEMDVVHLGSGGGSG